MDLIIRKLDGPMDKVYPYHEIETLATNPPTRSAREIVFVTGNKNKVDELGEHIKSKLVDLRVLSLDLTEIQDSDPLKIVQAKCVSAFDAVNKLPRGCGDVKRAVLIEDVCLNFKALNGMPGPYIKWFLEAVGIDGLPRMLTGFDDKSAEAVCVYALMEDPSQIVFCKGSVQGQIIDPRGSSWGWDPIFEEDRTKMTFGEMDAALKAKFSHRANAITVLKKYLSVS